MYRIVYEELASLERELGVPAGTLYAISNSIDRHYRRVSLSKRGGGLRVLSVPDEPLKRIQRRIAERLLAFEPISRYATAYCPGSSVRANASPHVGKPLVLKLDIRHFFDSIGYARVKERAFPAERYGEPLRILLTILCYYRDVLPQGAPTSPYITNIVMYPFDERVGDWCRARGITYTRYSDDMTFSGDFSPERVTAYIAAELKREGFVLNRAKTEIATAAMRQSVTGIVVNDRPRVSAEYRRTLRQELYYIGKFGVEGHLEARGEGAAPDEYLRSLLGRISWALSVSPDDGELICARGELRKLLEKYK